MSSSENGITAFVRYMTLGEDRREGTRARTLIPDAARVEFNLHGRELYSYGRHFPLARYIPAARGRQALWLINGDRWGGGGWSLTSRHQSETRNAIASAITDAAAKGKTVRSMVIPFTALTGAGIVPESIRPIHVRDDWNERVTMVASIPASHFRGDLPSRATLEARSRINAPRGEAIHGTATLYNGPAAVSITDEKGETMRTMELKVTRSVCYRGYEYNSTDAGGYVDYDPPKTELYLYGMSVTVAEGEDDIMTLTWIRHDHHLGDSLFSAARTNGKRYRYVSSFDTNERQPLYFLAALPRTSRASTVDMAIEDLAPAAVHAAMARGLEVRRQGDIFLVPTPYSDAEVYGRAVSRARLTQFTRGSNARKGETGYRPDQTPAQRTMQAQAIRDAFRASMRGYMETPRRVETPAGWRKAKRATLAGYVESIARHTARIAAGDNVCKCDGRFTKNRPCAYCKLPQYYRGYTAANAARGLERDTAAHAAELVRPRHIVRDKGYAAKVSAVFNRADGFNLTDGNRARVAIASARTDPTARFAPSPDMAKIRQALSIHGTAHTATEMVKCARGVTYVRGIVRHEPTVTLENRRRDHANVKLAAGWYLAVRNTVPRH